MHSTTLLTAAAALVGFVSATPTPYAMPEPEPYNYKLPDKKKDGVWWCDGPDFTGQCKGIPLPVFAQGKCNSILDNYFRDNIVSFGASAGIKCTIYDTNACTLGNSADVTDTVADLRKSERIEKNQATCNPLKQKHPCNKVSDWAGHLRSFKCTKL